MKKSLEEPSPHEVTESDHTDLHKVSKLGQTVTETEHFWHMLCFNTRRQDTKLQLRLSERDGVKRTSMRSAV